MDDQTRRIIEDECTKLSIAYARHVDFKEYDRFVLLFSEEGELNVTGKTVRGRENLTRAMAARPENLHSRHVLTNIYIRVINEDQAVGISYLTLYRHIGEGLKGNDSGPRIISGPAAIGHYEDRFVRTREGWRFASRVLHFVFRVEK
jgi:SnoaL-like domain